MRRILLLLVVASVTAVGPVAGATHEPPGDNPCNLDGHREEMRGSYVTGETVVWLDGNEGYVATSSPGGTVAVNRYAEVDASRATVEVYSEIKNDRVSEPYRTTEARVGGGAPCLFAAGSRTEVDQSAVLFPPGPPATGPAGTEYPFPLKPFEYGVDGLGGYAVYEPNPRPAGPVPVLIMLRGACVYTGQACDTFNRKNEIMGAWREHLVKKGNIVIFPHYQNADEPALEQQRIADALRAALQYLSQPGHAIPDVARIGMFGVSRGSQMTANVAAHWVELGLGDLPHPKWLLIAQPGPTSAIDYAKLADIPPDTKVVVLVAEDDALAGETKAKLVWNGLGQIPLANRDFIRVRSDRRGVWATLRLPDPTACRAAESSGVASAVVVACATPGFLWSSVPKSHYANPTSMTGNVTADHFFLAGGDGWTLEIYVGRKIAQALVECTGGISSSCGYALGDTAEQRFMGTWSDGLAVKELCVTHNPAEPWDETCAHN